jgi:hypothetical protein
VAGSATSELSPVAAGWEVQAESNNVEAKRIVDIDLFCKSSSF